MLLNRVRQLLTAYVDGELNNRQSRLVARLLRSSPEARHLLQKLQEDAQALRLLPRPTLPTDFTEPVLHTITERRLSPGQHRMAKFSSTTAWLTPLTSWLAAAAVLCLLGVASYLYFAVSLTQSVKPDLVKGQSSSVSITSDSSLSKSEEPQGSASARSTSKNTLPLVARDSEGITPHRESPRLTASRQSIPPSKEETALTDRLEMFQLDRVENILPVIFKLDDLEEEAPRKKLLAELRKDSIFRLELPCPHGTKAFERVREAATTLRIQLIVDKPAQERIKQKWRTSYALYLENITAEELIQFLQRIGVEDHKGALNKPAETLFDHLVLARMTGQHRKELSTLLGIDPITTGRQPVKSAAGEGTTPRPEAGNTSLKTSEHVALVLAYNHARPSPGSEEIKRSLESRQPARAGTLRILIVLRG